MTNVLSQDEVDSLLEGISKGKVQTESAEPEVEDEIQVYDFSKQAGPVHLRMPTLGIINERFVGFVKAGLSSMTGAAVDVNIDTVESIKFGKFTRSIPLPTSLNIFRMEPLRGFALFVLEGSLVFAFVDTLFGGKSGTQVKLEGKGFTSIEARIIDKIVKEILENLENAWADVHKLKMVFARSEIDPQFAGIATPNDMVIAIRFTVDIENFSGVMTLCIPYSTIEPLRDKLKHRFQSEKLEVDEKWTRYLKEKMRELTVVMTCSLGKATITGRELLNLTVDDVIQLDQKVADPIIMNVEGVPKFKGYPGAASKKKAIRIDGLVDKE